MTVANASGTGVFQGDTVPYFEYTPFIPSGATSAIENWQFLFAPGVTGVNFSVEVDAAVPAQASVLRWTVLRQGVTSNELTAVWANNSNDVWAVGLNNTIVHYNGSGWAQPITGLQFASYTSVHGTVSTTYGSSVDWARPRTGTARDGRARRSTRRSISPACGAVRRRTTTPARTAASPITTTARRGRRSRSRSR